MNDSLKLDMFFPGELLSITSVDHDDSSIHIKMRSKTHSSNSYWEQKIVDDFLRLR